MKSIDTPTSNPLEIYQENLKKMFSHDWIFNSPIEKMIIAVSFLWTLLSLLYYVWGLFT